MSFRAFPDNQQLTKHVESTFVSCLDAGSTPASYTMDGDTDLPSARVSISGVTGCHSVTALQSLCEIVPMVVGLSYHGSRIASR